MSDRVICDASAVIATLLDAGPDGVWATEHLSGAALAAPSLLPFEAANIIRRHEIAKLIGADQAAQAHADLLELAVESWPYELFAARSWELRHNLTIYDASYVALAEFLDVPLATLDRGMSTAPGVRCQILTPA